MKETDEGMKGKKKRGKILDKESERERRRKGEKKKRREGIV